MTIPPDPFRSVPGDPRGRADDDGVLHYSGTVAPAGTVGAGEVDEHGVIYYPGDEESQRAPGSALVLLILSLVAGGLYVWLFWPQKSGFDWAAAVTLRTPELAVLGGVVMWLGGVLFIRHGLVWAVRLGALVAAVPMARALIAAIVDHEVMDVGAAALSFVLSGGPALLVLVLSFLPPVAQWRRRRRQAVATEAAERKARTAGRAPASRPGVGLERHR
ncbi:hypothetical protein [Nakamurella deserti]|uniref:hypothetical protein n=1 Tax=Nakamurella deserti TaxID=2164074 RepID=UPI000DBEA041|nr:hypothetical protein [Nakamurella deserti]